MPLNEYHVTAAGGAYVTFGNDIVDGYPMAPVKLTQNTQFFVDPHAGAMNRLRILALVNAGSIASGATVPASAAINTKPGVQNAWFRQGSGVPGQETE